MQKTSYKFITLTLSLCLTLLLNGCIIHTSHAAGINEAYKYLGWNETNTSTQLIELFKKEGLENINPKETPWCAQFINATERLAGHKGTGSLLARSYLHYGIPVTTPQYGDIVVFSRGKNLGHVAYFIEIVNKNGIKWVKVIGGNQSTEAHPDKSDTVSIKYYPYSSVLGFRRSI